MTIPLVQALEQMNLEPGKTYQYPVKGQVVEVRVLDKIPPEMLPAPLVESDVMLDAWAELPEPSEGFITRSRLGEPDLPDPPEIPPEDEGA